MSPVSPEPVLITPELGRAFTAGRRPDALGFELRAWTLSDPATALATCHIEHDRFIPHSPVHLAWIDDALWVATSVGHLEELTADLVSRRVRRTSWTGVRGTASGVARAASGRRLLVSQRGEYAVLDLPSEHAHPVPLQDEDDIDGEAFALSADGRLAVVSRYGRYSGESHVQVLRVGGDDSRRACSVRVDGNVVGVAITPAGRHVAALLDTEQAIVAPVTWLSMDDWNDEFAIPFDPARGGWINPPPAVRWLNALDDERVVLAGRTSARVVEVRTGVVLREVAVRGTAAGLVNDGARTTLWTRTPTGFQGIDLG